MKELVIGRKVKRIVLLDDEDFDRISQYPWHARKGKNTQYAQCIIYEDSEYVKSIQMHREILNLPKYDGNNGVDHRNGNGLDNRRSNLRVCSNAENQWNRGKPRTNTSGFKGVLWCSRDNKWKSQICIDGKKHFLGYYDTPEEAHAAYCEKAKELHGVFFNSGKSKRRRRKKQDI